MSILLLIERRLDQARKDLNQYQLDERNQIAVESKRALVKELESMLDEARHIVQYGGSAIAAEIGA